MMALIHGSGMRALALCVQRIVHSAFIFVLVVQIGKHDSVEDALAALKLYNVYQQLKTDGRLEEKLQVRAAWCFVYVSMS